MKIIKLKKIPAMLMVAVLGQGDALAEERKTAPAPDRDKAATAKQAQKKDAANKPRASTVPVYVPPMRGAPVARVGGGTRGIGDDLPYVSVVTPEHTGYSSSPQPVLYWYLSEPLDTRFEFALINDDEIEPIIELASEREMQKGLNFLDLSEHGVSLKPGIIYQWSVALVGQPETRSSDIVSSGTIELVELGADQRAALAQATGEESVMLYAREGYWYDAFTGLSRLIDAKPGNAGLLETRAALLRQVGLEEVANAGN